jgi:hypothetical protein
MEKELIGLNIIIIGEAEKMRNEAFLDCVLSDDLLLGRSNGKILNKKEYLASLWDRSNTFDYLMSGREAYHIRKCSRSVSSTASKRSSLR